MDAAVRRTPPDCVAGRRYTCDVASFYYYGRWRVRLLEYAAPKDASLEWRPGLEKDMGNEKETAIIEVA